MIVDLYLECLTNLQCNLRSQLVTSPRLSLLGGARPRDGDSNAPITYGIKLQSLISKHSAMQTLSTCPIIVVELPHQERLWILRIGDTLRHAASGNEN